MLLSGGLRLDNVMALSDDDFTPTTDIAWYSSFWAEDPLWTNRPADGVAVDRWRNAGTLRTSGAHLTADGLVLPGVAGNYASTPDSNALDITGDITLVARVAMTDWTPSAAQVLNAKWTATSNQRSYRFDVNANGTMQLYTSADGAANVSGTSTVAPTVTDGASLWVAVSLNVNDGAGNRVYTFWTSTDGVTWTQLGSTVTTAGTTSIFNSTAPLEFGSITTGTTSNLNGTVSVARIYSGSGFTTSGPSGTLVLDADFRTTPGATSFTAATGQPVTVLSTFSANQSVGAAQPTYRGAVAILNNRPAVDFDGTDDRLEILTGVSLAQPFSVVWVGSYDTVTGGAILGPTSGSSSNRVGVIASLWVSRYGAAAALTGGTTVVDTRYMARFFANDTSSVIAVNGTTISTGSASSDSLNQIILGAGRTAPSTYSEFHNGKTAFLGIFPGDITTSPRWPDFKAWCRIHYNIVIA